MQPIVSIACLTFNHERFIREALDSFLSQETSFEYEIVIGDGGSTDSNRQILKAYQQQYGNNKIKLLLPDKDPGIGGMLNQIFLACIGQYIAICEGDDYWTDRTKLQKQVSFLESNNDYVLTHSDISFVNGKGEKIHPDKQHSEIKAKIKNGHIFGQLLTNGNFIYTPTVCFRRNALPEKKLRQKDTWYIFDYWYWLLISTEGKFFYEPEITSIYRRHESGATQTTGFFAKKYRVIDLDIIKFAFYKKDKTFINQNDLNKKAYILIRESIFSKDMLTLLFSMTLNPVQALSFLKYVLKYWGSKLRSKINSDT